MPIKFKVIERGEPGVAGGGTKKFYASANVTGEKSLAGLTRDIEKISTVSGGLFTGLSFGQFFIGQ